MFLRQEFQIAFPEIKSAKSKKTNISRKMWKHLIYISFSIAVIHAFPCEQQGSMGFSVPAVSPTAMLTGGPVQFAVSAQPTTMMAHPSVPMPALMSQPSFQPTLMANPQPLQATSVMMTNPHPLQAASVMVAHQSMPAIYAAPAPAVYTSASMPAYQFSAPPVVTQPITLIASPVMPYAMLQPGHIKYGPISFVQSKPMMMRMQRGGGGGDYPRY